MDCAEWHAHPVQRPCAEHVPPSDHFDAMASCRQRCHDLVFEAGEALAAHDSEPRGRHSRTHAGEGHTARPAGGFLPRFGPHHRERCVHVLDCGFSADDEGLDGDGCILEWLPDGHPEMVYTHLEVPCHHHVRPHGYKLGRAEIQPPGVLAAADVAVDRRRTHKFAGIASQVAGLQAQPADSFAGFRSSSSRFAVDPHCGI
mmetsp:Transcript_107815/g.214232  ORF Transcript_107815/g.214232 Transcript_107815/m.214232 type:complete len:201 (+) Transcript_107815:186-788(+)